MSFWEKGEEAHMCFKTTAAAVAATEHMGGTGEEAAINPAMLGAGEERGLWGQTASI